jgi:chromosomal replication initiation ATPase DnaA
MSNQFPLNLKHAPSFASEDFLKLPCNEDAVYILQNWPSWTSHAVALIGPKGSGKSHLGHAWSEKSGAIFLTPQTDITKLGNACNLFVDDADCGLFPEDMLFHVYNWCKETSGSLLFTGQTAPNRWTVTLPDLKSRLATVQVTSIGSPDEDALTMVLAKLFADRQLIIDDTILPYIVSRMERSFDMANKIVSELDRISLAKKRRLTKILAKEVLEKLDTE